MTNFNNKKNDFMEAWRRLHDKWLETIAMWDDSKSQEFERVFWNPLETEVIRAQREIDRLGEVITIIEHKKQN